MSNYSRHFDDSAGGHDGHGGPPQRYGRPREEFRGGTGRGGGGRYQSASGGADRKIMKRKAVDFHVPIMKHMEERMIYRDHRDRPTLEPTADSLRALPAMVDDVSHNPALGICSKYIGLAVNKLKAPITAMCWSPDGRKVITGAHTGEFTWWNGIQFNFEGIVQQAHEDPIRVMQWMNNDLLLLSADEGGVVKYWQTTMNNLKAFKAHKEPVRDISSSPNNLHFVTCSDDQTASIWDLETSKELLCLKGHGWDVKAAKWHPTKGIIITGSKDQLIKVWDPRTGAGGNNHGRNPHCLADIHAHKNTVNRLAWSPLNPNWFLSGSRDNLVKLFDIRTMKDFQTMRAHKKEITALTWHPTSERLFASGSHDGAIHQWFVGDVEPQGEITGAHDSAVYGLQWHPAGHLLASASNDHTTRFWARNRPGDDMTDKYNVSSLPAAQKAIAVSALVEAAKMNPSKYSRLPAALAEFAQQGQQELAEATAKSAYEQANASSGTEFIPGMGGVAGAAPGAGGFQLPGMGPQVKKEPSYSGGVSSGGSAMGYGASSYGASQVDQKPYSSQTSGMRDGRPAERGSDRDRERKRSRSRSRDRDTGGYGSRGGSSSSSNTRFAPPPPQGTVAPQGNYNAFFPGPPPGSQPQMPPQMQQQHASFFPPPPPPLVQAQPHHQHNPQRAYPQSAPHFAGPPQGNYPPQQGGYPGGYPPQGFPPPPQQQFPPQGYPAQQPPYPGQGHPSYPSHPQQQQQQRYQR